MEKLKDIHTTQQNLQACKIEESLQREIILENRLKMEDIKDKKDCLKKLLDETTSHDNERVVVNIH